MRQDGLMLLVMIDHEKAKMKQPRQHAADDFAVRWMFQTVPASAADKRTAVERTYAQLLTLESIAYGLVASTISLPVLTRITTSSKSSQRLASGPADDPFCGANRI